MIQEHGDDWTPQANLAIRRWIDFHPVTDAFSAPRARLVVIRLDSAPVSFQAQRKSGHELVRLLVSRTLTDRPSDWLVTHSASGRPILLLDGKSSGFSVSVSHSGPWLAAGLAWEGAVGVDVERASNRKHAPEIAQWLGWPRLKNGAAQFIRQWVLWEAAAKCTGRSILCKQNPGFTALQAVLQSHRFGTSNRWSGCRDRLDEEAHVAMVVRTDAPVPLACRELSSEQLSPWHAMTV